MKKNLLLSILLIFTVSIFNSCSKFEEGPGLSLKSKKARLANTWAIETVYDDKGSEVPTAEFLNSVLGNDSIDFPVVPEFKFVINKDETAELSIAVSIFSLSIPGTWEFTGETGLKISFEASEFFGTSIPSSVNEYNILRLASKELWLEYTDSISEKKYEIHLIPEE